MTPCHAMLCQAMHIAASVDASLVFAQRHLLPNSAPSTISSPPLQASSRSKAHLLRHWPAPGVKDGAKRALVAAAAAGAPSGELEAARLGGLILPGMGIGSSSSLPLVCCTAVAWWLTCGNMAALAWGVAVCPSRKHTFWRLRWHTSHSRRPWPLQYKPSSPVSASSPQLLQCIRPAGGAGGLGTPPPSGDAW